MNESGYGSRHNTNPLGGIHISDYESQNTWRAGSKSESGLLKPAKKIKTITVDGIEKLIMNMCVNIAKKNEEDYDHFYRKLYKHQNHIHFTQDPSENESRILSQLALNVFGNVQFETLMTEYTTPSDDTKKLF